jgi:hypothetical protein
MQAHVVEGECMTYSDNLNTFWTICYKGTYIHGCSGRVGENIRKNHANTPFLTILLKI